MATAVYRPSNSFPLLLILLIGVALIAAVLSAHAVAGHGAIAEEVHKCLCDQGADRVFTRQADGRSAFCVILCDGRIGVQVDDPDSNVTAYKTRYDSWDKLRDWLGRKGYEVMP